MPMIGATDEAASGGRPKLPNERPPDSRPAHRDGPPPRDGSANVTVVANEIGQVGIGGLVAVGFARNFPGAHFLRGLLLVAWLLPALVVGTVWTWLFATQYGVVNYFLSSLGLISGPVHWTGGAREAGLPMGIQLIGPLGSEALLLQLATQLGC